MRRLRHLLLLTAALVAARPAPCAAFDLQFFIPNNNPSVQFTQVELDILNEALPRVERMWETVITGYRPGISIASVPITINATTSGLAAANFSGTIDQGGFRLTTSGFININVNEIENFQNWQGHGANGLNFIDELLAHETGHVLGVGTLWDDNSVYVNNTFQFTGQYGVAAYQAEYNDALLFAPVENAGNPGTPNSHWDQRMRSSMQEGNPADPWSLDPRVGVVDSLGRDRGLELMTGAIDPDFGEPYLARFTVQSMRDIGYTVTEFVDFNGDGGVDLLDRAVLLANMGAVGLQTDSIALGDANRDRRIDQADLRLWLDAMGIPEPSAWTLAALALAAVRLRGRRR